MEYNLKVLPTADRDGAIITWMRYNGIAMIAGSDGSDAVR